MEETFVEYIVKTKTSLSAIGIRIGAYLLLYVAFYLQQFLEF